VSSFQRRPGASSRVTGGDNHKLQGGAHHHQLPQARVIQAMAPTAQTGVTNIHHEQGRHPIEVPGFMLLWDWIF
jgi:hypothetical protein